MLKETYLAMKKRTEIEHPGAVMMVITRTAGSMLSPSRKLLEEYKKGMSWDEYTIRFKQEMDNDRCKQELQRIKKLSEDKDVYLICYEKPPKNCHRYLIMDMIKNIGV